MGTSTNQNSDFYIGWQEEAPDSYSKKTRNFIFLLCIITPLVAALFVVSQRGFEDSVFEFGQLTSLEGILVTDPIPMLKMENTSGIESILLVGFGKMGAEKDIKGMEEKEGISLNGKKVKLRGTLIYDKSKKALELTEGTGSFIESKNAEPYAPATINHGNVKLRGEIYDPKCALGVMKPGYGKPHRSCAIRCISGGIPPLLSMKDNKGKMNHVLLLDEQGKRINDQVLAYVADQIQICGRLEQQDDWLVLYTDPTIGIFRLQPYWMEGEAPMCSK